MDSIRIDIRLLLAILILLAVAAYFYLARSEPPLSTSEFRQLISSTTKVAVIQDLRSLPEGDSAARKALQDCGVQTAYALSLLGKNASNYAYESDSCFGGLSPSSRQISECESEIFSEGRYAFIIRYSPANSTGFFKRKSIFEGDAAYLTDCAISRVVR